MKYIQSTANLTYQPSEEMMTKENNAMTARNLEAVHLPPFWLKAPLAWFRAAEAQFVIRGIKELLIQYYLVLAALAELQIERVSAIVEVEPASASYEQLRTALISKHMLSQYQQVDMLVSMEPLCGQELSDMLAEMEKFTPKDMQSFYSYHFLYRLPHEIRVLLAQDHLSNMAVLAEEADQLMALYQPQHHDTNTAVSPPEKQTAAARDLEDDTVAAVGGKKDKSRKEEELQAASPQPFSISRPRSLPSAGPHKVGQQSLPLRGTLRLARETKRLGRQHVC
jgi:hypothetical protein